MRRRVVSDSVPGGVPGFSVFVGVACSVPRCVTSARNTAGLYARVGRTLPRVSAASGDQHAAVGVDGCSDEVGLLSLRAARAPGGKRSGQHWTKSMTLSISLGVSLTATSSIFLF
jgi:hypothetical protein